MSIAIDPSEMRAPAQAGAPSKPHPLKSATSARVGRIALLTVLGGVGLVGLSAGAYSMLSGLAGPPPSKVRMGRVSADWPDLRDGVPALVSSAGAPGAAPAPVPALPASPIPAKAAFAPIESKSFESKPVEPKPVQVAAIAPAAKLTRLPIIENAATVPPAPAVALVEKARTAPLVAPATSETTRARAATGATFAALPPAPSAPEGTAMPKPAPVVARAKPAAKPITKPTPAAPDKVAAAQPAQAAEPEAEETDVFGMKVPSLAPMGRKFAEGIEALGNAVKRLPEQF